VPVPMADQIVHDRDALEESGTHSLIVGLFAELLDLAGDREEAAA
jgi:hypothetical protein